MTLRRTAAGLAAVFIVLTVLVSTRWHPLLSADEHADRDAVALDRHHHWLLSAARAVTHLGDPAVVTVGAIVLAAAFAAAGQRRVAAYLLLVRAAALVVETAAKEAVRRHRPVLAHPVAHAAGFSFPSGHAVGSAAFYASVAIAAGRRLPLPASVAVGVLVPVAVAASRVLLGVHFPSDVAAGLVLGWAIAVGAAALLLWRGYHDADAKRQRQMNGPA